MPWLMNASQSPWANVELPIQCQEVPQASHDTARQFKALITHFSPIREPLDNHNRNITPYNCISSPLITDLNPYRLPLQAKSPTPCAVGAKETLYTAPSEYILITHRSISWILSEPRYWSWFVLTRVRTQSGEFILPIRLTYHHRLRIFGKALPVDGTNPPSNGFGFWWTPRGLIVKTLKNLEIHYIRTLWEASGK